MLAALGRGRGTGGPRKQADINFGMSAFVELMQADETNREAEKFAWR